jgi:hypothetical protein
MKRTPRPPIPLFRKWQFFVVICSFLLNAFGPCPLAQANEFQLPEPGAMVALSPSFNPPLLKGLKIHPENPFHFDFILDKGDSKDSTAAMKLVKYFLASITIPEKDLWVNLSPYEKDRIIPQSFGRTEMGRDLLVEDYMLKQITASLIYPEGETGKKFWHRIYAEAARKFGTTNIPVNTFNKVWIVPDKTVVYENAQAGTAYVVEAKLKVMLEEDYLAMQKNHGTGTNSWTRNGLKTAVVSVPNIMREIVIPELTKEVNKGKNFAQLRQVFNSLILANWYKNKIRQSILAQVYEDKMKIAGVGYKNSLNAQAIYQRYLEAFKKGVYSYIKDADFSNSVAGPRKYFSGGVSFWGKLATTITDNLAMVTAKQNNTLILGVNIVAQNSNAAMRADGHVKVIGFFPGFGSYRAYLNKGTNMYQNGLPQVRKIYEEAAEILHLEKDGKPDPEQLFLTDKHISGRLWVDAHIYSSVLVYNLALQAQLLHQGDQRGMFSRFDAYAADSFGILEAAVASGALTLRDGLLLAQNHSDVLWNTVQLNGNRPHYIFYLKNDNMAHHIEELTKEFGDNFSIFRQGSDTSVGVYVDKDILPRFLSYIHAHNIYYSQPSTEPMTLIVHSKRLEPGRQKVKDFIEKMGIKFNNPDLPIISSSKLGVLSTATEVEMAVLGILDEPSYIYQMLKQIEQRGADCFVELGLGGKNRVYIVDRIKVRTPFYEFLGDQLHDKGVLDEMAANDALVEESNKGNNAQWFAANQAMLTNIFADPQLAFPEADQQFLNRIIQMDIVGKNGEKYSFRFNKADTLEKLYGDYVQEEKFDIEHIDPMDGTEQTVGWLEISPLNKEGYVGKDGHLSLVIEDIQLQRQHQQQGILSSFLDILPPGTMLKENKIINMTQIRSMLMAILAQEAVRSVMAPDSMAQMERILESKGADDKYNRQELMAVYQFLHDYQAKADQQGSHLKNLDLIFKESPIGKARQKAGFNIQHVVFSSEEGSLVLTSQSRKDEISNNAMSAVMQKTVSNNDVEYWINYFKPYFEKSYADINDLDQDFGPRLWYMMRGDAAAVRSINYHYHFPLVHPDDPEMFIEFGRRFREEWEKHGFYLKFGDANQYLGRITKQYWPSDIFVKDSEKQRKIIQTSQDQVLEELMGLWQGLYAVMHLRLFGPHADKVNGKDELLDNDLIVRNTRGYIQTLLSWGNKKEWDLKPRTQPGYQGTINFTYRDLMLWGLVVMLDPLVHDYVLEPTHNEAVSSAEGTRLAGFARWPQGGQEAMTESIRTMLSDLHVAVGRGETRLVTNKEIEDLLVEAFSTDWKAKGLRSPFEAFGYDRDFPDNHPDIFGGDLASPVTSPFLVDRMFTFVAPAELHQNPEVRKKYFRDRTKFIYAAGLASYMLFKEIPDLWTYIQTSFPRLAPVIQALDPSGEFQAQAHALARESQQKFSRFVKNQNKSEHDVTVRTVPGKGIPGGILHLRCLSISQLLLKGKNWGHWGQEFIYEVRQGRIGVFVNGEHWDKENLDDALPANAQIILERINTVNQAMIMEGIHYSRATLEESDRIYAELMAESETQRVYYEHGLIERIRNFNLNGHLTLNVVDRTPLPKKDIFQRGLFRDANDVYWILKKKSIGPKIGNWIKNIKKREVLAYLLLKGKVNLTPVRSVTEDEARDLEIPLEKVDDYYLTRVVTHSNAEDVDVPHHSPAQAFSAFFVANIFLRKYDAHWGNLVFIRPGIPVSIDQDQTNLYYSFPGTNLGFQNFLSEFFSASILSPFQNALTKESKRTFFEAVSGSGMRFMVNHLRLGQAFIENQGIDKRYIEQSIKDMKSIRDVRELVKEAGYDGKELEDITDYIQANQRTLGADVDLVWSFLTGQDGGFHALDKSMSALVPSDSNPVQEVKNQLTRFFPSDDYLAYLISSIFYYHFGTSLLMDLKKNKAALSPKIEHYYEEYGRLHAKFFALSHDDQMAVNSEEFYRAIMGLVTEAIGLAEGTLIPLLVEYREEWEQPNGPESLKKDNVLYKIRLGVQSARTFLNGMSLLLDQHPKGNVYGVLSLIKEMIFSQYYKSRKGNFLIDDKEWDLRLNNLSASSTRDLAYALLTAMLPYRSVRNLNLKLTADLEVEGAKNFAVIKILSPNNPDEGWEKTIRYQDLWPLSRKIAARMGGTFEEIQDVQGWRGLSLRFPVDQAMQGNSGLEDPVLSLNAGDRQFIEERILHTHIIGKNNLPYFFRYNKLKSMAFRSNVSNGPVDWFDIYQSAHSVGILLIAPFQGQHYVNGEGKVQFDLRMLILDDRRQGIRSQLLAGMPAGTVLKGSVENVQSIVDMARGALAQLRKYHQDSFVKEYEKLELNLPTQVEIDKMELIHEQYFDRDIILFLDRYKHLDRREIPLLTLNELFRATPLGRSLENGKFALNNISKVISTDSQGETYLELQYDAEKVVQSNQAMEAKPQRELDEKTASLTAAIEIQLNLDVLSTQLRVIEGLSRNAQEEKDKLEVTNKETALVSQLRLLYTAIHEEIDVKKGFSEYAQYLKDLRVQRDSLYARYDKAWEEQNKDALKRLNLEAIKLNQQILKAQVLVAGMMLTGLGHLQGSMKRNAALATLEGAINSSRNIQDELRFRIGRLNAASKLKAIEATDWLGHMVRTYQLGDFDIHVIPSATEGQASSVTIRKQQWIKLDAQLRQVFIDAKAGKMTEALQRLNRVKDIFRTRYIPLYNRYGKIVDDITGLQDLLKVQIQGQPLENAVLGEVSTRIDDLIKHIQFPKQKIWVDVEYKDLGSAFRSYLHRTEGSYEEIGKIFYFRTLMEIVAGRLKEVNATGKRLTIRQNHMLQGYLEETQAWAHRGLVVPKEIAEIKLQGVIENLNNGAYGLVLAEIEKTIKQFDLRVRNIKSILQRSQPAAVQIYAAYRQADSKKRLDQIIDDINQAKVDDALSKIRELRELYFDHDVVEPGLQRAQKGLDYVQTQLSEGFNKEQAKDFIQTIKDDIAHQLSFRIIVTNEVNQKRYVYVTPGTTLQGLLRMGRRDILRLQVKMGDRVVPSSEYSAIKLADLQRVTISDRAMSTPIVKDEAMVALIAVLAFSIGVVALEGALYSKYSKYMAKRQLLTSLISRFYFYDLIGQNLSQEEFEKYIQLFEQNVSFLRSRNLIGSFSRILTRIQIEYLESRKKELKSAPIFLLYLLKFPQQGEYVLDNVGLHMGSQIIKKDNEERPLTRLHFFNMIAHGLGVIELSEKHLTPEEFEENLDLFERYYKYFSNLSKFLRETLLKSFIKVLTKEQLQVLRERHPRTAFVRELFKIIDTSDQAMIEDVPTNGTTWNQRHEAFDKYFFSFLKRHFAQEHGNFNHFADIGIGMVGAPTFFSWFQAIQAHRGEISSSPEDFRVTGLDASKDVITRARSVARSWHQDYLTRRQLNLINGGFNNLSDLTDLYGKFDVTRSLNVFRYRSNFERNYFREKVLASLRDKGFFIEGDGAFYIIYQKEGEQLHVRQVIFHNDWALIKETDFNELITRLAFLQDQGVAPLIDALRLGIKSPQFLKKKELPVDLSILKLDDTHKGLLIFDAGHGDSGDGAMVTGENEIPERILQEQGWKDREIAFKVMGFRPGDRVINIDGYGDNRTALFVASHGGNYTSFDLNDDNQMVTNAILEGYGASKKARAVTGYFGKNSAASGQIPDHTVDIVMSGIVSDPFSNNVDTLEEAIRVIKPGGIIAVISPPGSTISLELPGIQRTIDGFYARGYQDKVRLIPQDINIKIKDEFFGNFSMHRIYRVEFIGEHRSQGEPKDRAMKTSGPGGIDLTPARMKMEVTGDAAMGIKFHLDPAMLTQLQNAPGFVPIIISEEPLIDLKGFLANK